MPWKPQHEDDFSTLGWQAIDWMTSYLARPDCTEYEPFIPYPEQEDFILRFYELDPATGRRKIHRGVISRPRGWGKSPFAGAMACLEALGPVRFGGWDADGQPVGVPWSEFRTPLVQVAAVSEEQTKNTWDAIQEMMQGPYLFDDYPGLEPMGSFINLPSGRIAPITSSGRSVKGARAVFAIMDQTEEWVRSNGGIDLATKMRSNAAKLGGSTLETPNAFIPGENSVAEQSAAFWSQIQEGVAKDDGLYFDHREAPADTDMSDRDSLMAGLRVAYGDASGHSGGCVIHDPSCPPGHVDLDRIVATVWDPATDPQVARSDFLNQVTHASDSWVSQPEIRSIIDRGRIVADGDPIVLGFDGSRGRAKGNPDATALVGMRVSDKHLFEVKIWERTPRDPQDWQPPMVDVEATIRDCFERYNVVAFYADPSGWTGQVAEWEAAYHRKLKVKASRNAPIAAWPRGKDSRVCEYVEQLRQAVAAGEITMADSPALVRHLLNARRRQTRNGYLLYKAYPDSPDKIDGAYAAVMAYKACLDAIAAGAGKRRQRQRRKVAVL
ncbi:hypothetical protein [Corynebacterium pygosceleis]|uniref:hypothetical protein n=1 Tax=Corynebacterium pygosceleis TaxID=2800406 RepID=UPI002005C3F3|nr:hypothetical protein [Corynebacterium pygosceleis]MCK7676348.1 hypothetical protein [Corynebacterium pygosceleis]